MTALEEIAEALDRLDEDTVELVREALARGEDPLEIIEQGIVVGIRTCGDKLEA